MNISYEQMVIVHILCMSLFLILIGFQDIVKNTTGAKIGNTQGYWFTFPNSTIGNNGNVKIILDDGSQIDVMNDAIVAGTGDYKKYIGGSVSRIVESPGPNYVAQVTLVEPPSSSSSAKEDDDEPSTVRITAEGGFYQAINDYSTDDNSTGPQIGELFQNQVYAKGKFGASSLPIGMNQGYCIGPVCNRVFSSGNGTITLLDDAIVQGTGPYSRFTGGSIIQTEIANNTEGYVADVTFYMKGTDIVDGDIVDGADDKAPPSEVTFLLNSGTDPSSSIYTPLLNGDGQQIGERFELIPLMASGTGESKGTITGYCFNFPPMNGTDIAQNCNRRLSLDGGDITVFNEIIMQGTGSYEKYTGGKFQEIIVSKDPVYSSRITLTPPEEKPANSTTVDQTEQDYDDDIIASDIESSSNAVGSGVASLVVVMFSFIL